jgi:2-C-methyl-D-erythritol 4-phosphate cytidylyltransferase/2-C-methyl-D-erythritol 2,4-cyclodiphosphate synthase
MHVVAVIAAAGRGRRFGVEAPKQLLQLAGRTVLQRSVDAFDRSGRVHEIIVTVPPDLLSSGALTLRTAATPLRIVAGGARRQDSVANGVKAAGDRADIVVIHDAARPFVSEALIGRTIDAAAEHGAAIAAVVASDTVKRASEDGAVVCETLPRQTIHLAQTPQAFRRHVLDAALALGRRGAEATDEAALAEQAGHSVRLVAGEPTNIKITTPDDLALARVLAGESVAAISRVGTGYDLHRLVAGRPLVLAGVELPSGVGPLGHSDGDVVCHALTDAMLGAAAAGDIGQHFAPTDPRWKDAPGLDLLARALALVEARSLRVENVDVVVVLEQPRIGPHVGEIRRRLAETLGVSIDRVSVKGKTNEGVDAVGRGEAIAAHAVALLSGERG